MRPTSLRQQLTRAAMLTTVLAILLSAGALLTYELMVYRRVGMADMGTQAELIARSTAPALQASDTRAIWENLYLLRQQPQIRAAAVYGRDGALIASHTATAKNELRARIPLAWDAWGPRFSGSTLEMVRPIEHNGARIGMLYLKAEHGVWQRFVDFALIVLGVSAVSLLAAYYLFALLQRRITAPLEKMTLVARDVIGSHDWSLRAPATDYKDLDVLVDAFNRMLSECETRTTELEREMVTRQGVERELRQADRQKDMFLATLAHELRNPLSPMTSAVALLQMPTVSPQAREKALAVLERQLQHIVRLVNDLLDASRVATGKLSLDTAPLNIGELLHTAAEGAQALAQQQGLQLQLHLPDEALYVNGDAVRLTQVFSNLLNNACRYTPHGGRVDLALTSADTSVVVTVTDTGIGVEPAMQERIFDLFEQADQSMQRGSAGLGVGLTLSRQIIQLHDGSLSMHSEGLHRGSCFTVRLPRLHPGSKPVDAAAATLPHPVPLRPLRILVADDNVDLTASLSAVLVSHGHEVEVVHDGEAAVRAARARVPDVALLDIGMPGLDGHQVARALRADPTTQGIHLVAITGWGRDADREAARHAGFDLHLLKPVNPEQLLRRLSEAHEAFRAPPAQTS
ncbi:MAG: response regulator [Hydrogenophaga sp.]|uniref:hybrid sensor histidine kinase/response regulator n=1 Tax=Hydrogenophaga sp. TaxID=1904254 RepID=UPI0026132411|nr:ATP-binding protein [Hydrogenophaga sp.]MCW5672289.1 response regulator [Hydrogenophaga sp.]